MATHPCVGRHDLPRLPVSFSCLRCPLSRSPSALHSWPHVGPVYPKGCANFGADEWFLGKHHLARAVRCTCPFHLVYGTEVKAAPKTRNGSSVWQKPFPTDGTIFLCVCLCLHTGLSIVFSFFDEILIFLCIFTRDGWQQMGRKQCQQEWKEDMWAPRRQHSSHVTLPPAAHEMSSVFFWRLLLHTSESSTRKTCGTPTSLI